MAAWVDTQQLVIAGRKANDESLTIAQAGGWRGKDEDGDVFDFISLMPIEVKS